jgi:dipeptidyl aminopeptidase/acylaminoacyl peptidase
MLPSTPVSPANPTNSPGIATSTVTTPTFTVVPPTPTLTLSPTPAPFEQYTIDYLRGRTYGSGAIEVLETMEETDSFTRYLIRYPSDGLNIYGFVNVPKGQGPFPVIIAIHGLVATSTYQTLDYTTPDVDAITQAGYIVFHPNLRGYPPSDNGDDLFRVGMSIDVLNLIALIKSGSSPTELLSTAAPDQIGLWGHSLGGNIILRVLTVSSDAKAAVLYAPLSGEETKNAELLAHATSDPTFQMEQAILPPISERISPMYYYSNITSPIQLHHGTADAVIPVTWSQETCEAVTAAGIQIECIYYPEERHTFSGRVTDEFHGAMLRFYEAHLAP